MGKRVERISPLREFNRQLLEEARGRGEIICQTHPTLPLLIWNYTKTCQYEQLWNPITVACRGLVTDLEGRVVARPFAKFFNLEEHHPQDIPLGPFRVFQKMDGSLIVLFHYANAWHAASRGSFTSDQAQKANSWFPRYRELLHQLDTNRTYLAEIIYPENRIVVNYGSRQELVLLAAIETATGIEHPLEPHLACEQAGELNFADLAAVLETQNTAYANEEGYILAWENTTGQPFRVKVKNLEYCQRHRILTNVSTYDIWEALRDDIGLEHILEDVPDEFYAWVSMIQSQLTNQITELETQIRSVFATIQLAHQLRHDTVLLTGEPWLARKEFALLTQQLCIGALRPHMAQMFTLYDGKPIKSQLWDFVKPPFRKCGSNLEADAE